MKERKRYTATSDSLYNIPTRERKNPSMIKRAIAAASLILVAGCSSEPNQPVPYTGTPAAPVEVETLDPSPTPTYRIWKLGDKATGESGVSLQLTEADHLTCKQAEAYDSYLVYGGCEGGIYKAVWTVTNGTPEPMDAMLMTSYSHDGEGEPITTRSDPKSGTTGAKILPGKSGKYVEWISTKHEPTAIVAEISPSNTLGSALFEGNLKELAGR